MKIAVLADIHANLAALEVVAAHIEAWQPDQVIVAGDVVNRGPRPLECLRTIQEKQRTEGWQPLVGNHEEYVIVRSLPDDPRSGPVYETYRSSHWTYEQLQCDVSVLEAMPFVHSLPAPDGSEVRVTHGSMRGTRDGIFPITPDRVLRKQIGEPPGLFCVAHTHWPLIRQLDDTLVVNVGAVGLPFDGDQRASYAQLTWQRHDWQSEIIRLEYDLQRAERDFHETGFVEDGGPLVQLMLVELRQACSQLFQWAKDFEQLTLAGEMTVAESVETFLATHR